MAEKIRLQKILAENGIASRRKSEEIIASGRVTVNGVRAKVGDKADPDRDRILIDGEPFLSGKEKNVYIMLHKPRGFVTTMNDEMGRKCVAQLVEDVGVRVFPVGRDDASVHACIKDIQSYRQRKSQRKSADSTCKRNNDRRQKDASRRY